MKRYKIHTILVPTDFSETADNAFKQAVMLAKKIEAKLVLVNIVELTSFTLPSEMLTSGLVSEQLLFDSKEKLKKLATKTSKENKIKVEFAAYIGNVSDNILRAAYLLNADIIIMGTHGASGIKEWLFGSQTYSVVKRTTIPVLTFNLSSRKHSFQKIIFPFNKNLLTIKKLEHVMAVARVYNSSILLFGFTDSEHSSDLTVIKNLGYILEERMAEESIKSSLSIKIGSNYALEISNFATNEKADLISVVINQNHNLDSVFRHKPEQSLVNHSDIPVLCIPVEY